MVITNQRLKKETFCRSWKWKLGKKFMLAAKWSALIKIDFEGEGERKAVQGNGSWQMVDSLLFSLLVNVLLSNGDWPFLQNQNFFHREPFSNQSLLQFFKTKCNPGVIKGKEFEHCNLKSHKKKHKLQKIIRRCRRSFCWVQPNLNSIQYKSIQISSSFISIQTLSTFATSIFFVRRLF